MRGGNVVSVERAEAILRKMELLYNEGDDHIQPTVVSYSIVMNGYVPDFVRLKHSCR